MTTPSGWGDEFRGLPSGEQFEAAMARLEQARLTSNEIRQRTEKATFKASPKNKMFTVTVSGRGELTSLVFRGDDYRSLPPAELADLLVVTFEKARKASMNAALQGIGELTPRLEMPMDLLGQSTSIEDFMNNVIEATSQALPNDSQLLRDQEGKP